MRDLRWWGTTIRAACFGIGAVLILSDVLYFRVVWPVLAGLVVAVVGEVTRDTMHWLVDKAGW